MFLLSNLLEKVDKVLTGKIAGILIMIIITNLFGQIIYKKKIKNKLLAMIIYNIIGFVTIVIFSAIFMLIIYTIHKILLLIGITDDQYTAIGAIIVFFNTVFFLSIKEKKEKNEKN